MGIVSSNVTYQPCIDGIRALAIIAVVIFHINPAWLNGGYLGVDLFFVVSGYLITSLIFNEANANSFNVLHFWGRRFRRIIPALLAMVVVLFCIGRFIIYPTDYLNLTEQVAPALLSYTNWFLSTREVSYWGWDAKQLALMHTWSLSVEVQFYLLYPLLLALLLRINHKTVLYVLLSGSVIGYSFFIYGLTDGNQTSYFMPQNRFWELLFGGVVAILHCIKNTYLPKNNKVVFAAFCLVVLSLFGISEDSTVQMFTILPIMSLSYVIYAYEKSPLLKSVLLFPIFQWIGKLSYSIYLWHWPILVIGKSLFTYADKTLFIIGSVCLTLCLSALSYYFIERKVTYNKFSITIMAFILAVVTYASYSFYAKGLNADVSNFNKVEWHGEYYSVLPSTPVSKQRQRQLYGVDFDVREYPDDILYYKNGGIIRNYADTNGDPDVVVLGDSHGSMWSSVINKIAQELRLNISFYSANATFAFFDIPVKQNDGSHILDMEEKRQFDEARLAFLERWRPKVVIISTYWGIRDIETMPPLLDKLKEWGINVLFIGQPPQIDIGDKSMLLYLSHLGAQSTGKESFYLGLIPNGSFERGVNIIERLLERYQGFHYAPVSDLYLKDGKVLVVKDNDVLYIDDDHLSEAGAQRAYKRLRKAIAQAYADNLGVEVD